LEMQLLGQQKHGGGERRPFSPPFLFHFMKKSDLLRALQTEIQKHNLSTFMDEKDKVVITGCTLCRKHFGTVEQFKRHITEDVLPPLLDKLSAASSRAQAETI
jgi:hypothetical protein